jgi:hypothetical protein
MYVVVVAGREGDAMDWWKDQMARSHAATEPFASAGRQGATDPGDADWVMSGDWRAWEAPALIVSGTSRYAAALARILGRSADNHRCVLSTATLTRDPENRRDPSAIAVSIATHQVGWVDKQHAAALAPLMSAGGPRTSIPNVPAVLLIGTVTDVQDDQSSDGMQQLRVFAPALWIDHESIAGQFPPELWGGNTARRVAWDVWRDSVQQ